MATYTPDERSKGVRLVKRSMHSRSRPSKRYTSCKELTYLCRIKAVHDADLIHTIVNTTPILHVSFNAPPRKDGTPQFPTILPMLGAIGTYPPHNAEAHIYLHGSSVARLFRLTASGEAAGIPLCVCATLLDGYVLALSPFHNSCNYRSAVCFGHGTLVTDAEEVAFALQLITNNSIPERWENSRQPPTKAELTATGVLKVRIETASTKTRAGGPSDDRADLQNEEVTGSTWTGVVPAYMMLGEPIAAESNRVKRAPEYLSDWVADVNSLNEQKAVDAVEG
ncbi:hypothetical protein LTR08_002321 [Meristemomyces frigidus]|nr:hypothetical protein LTR08_002321 [Meristemomyces frigidus]